MYKRVKEATYLTAEKAWSYRAILRYFYIQHEKMREFLFPEEIMDYLKTDEAFSDYTMESLHQDLDALVKWGNLNARQEHGKSRTIEEFKKKRFRYQCTPYTVEFERMLVNLEGSGETFGGSLERTQFERLYQSLQKIESIASGKVKESNEECAQLWKDLTTYFRQINQNTSDYMAYLNSEEVEEQMQSEAFLVYKDQFTMYLREFIIALQGTALQIQDILTKLSTDQLNSFFHQVIEHEKRIFRFEEQSTEQSENDLSDTWKNIRAWFLGNEHGESEYNMLQERTSESIRRITRVVQRLGERHQHFRSRRKDYLHLAKWFDRLDDLDEAHQLSSVVFGVFHTRHFYIDDQATDDIYASVWDEPPMEHITKPAVRHYRERTKAGAVTSNKDKKEAMMQKHLEQRQHEQQLIEKYIHSNQIIVKDLPMVETHVRKNSPFLARKSNGEEKPRDKNGIWYTGSR